MSRLFVFFQYLIPQHALSRLLGKLAEGKMLKNLLISLFIKRYGVDMSEAETTDPKQFNSFNHFFTRALAANARPLAQKEGAVLCPADGSISEIGDIEENRILQAKGQHYTVAQLLTDEDDAKIFHDGSFATVYLAPKDYHRVHMPIEGKLLQTTYVPGKLFSVNRVTANSVPNLFARNERLVCLFDTPAGKMALVLVGAMVVAGIETVWSGQVCPAPSRVINRTNYEQASPAVQLASGVEMGRFKLGSTVIVLFEPGKVTLSPSLAAGSTTRMGQLLGTLL